MFQNKYFYKPLIATSLALSLCSIQAREITSSTTIIDNTISDISDTSRGKSGLYIHSNMPIGITLGVDTVVNPVINQSGNAYGIFVDTSGTTTISSTNFQTLTIKEVSAIEGKEAYVFKNAGSNPVLIYTTGLIAGTKTEVTNEIFGIYNNLDGAKYNFGNASSYNDSTAFKINSQNMSNGASAYGVVLKKSAIFEGTAVFTNLAIDGKGGNAIGIKGMGDSTLTLNNASIAFGEFTNGSQSDQMGEAIGIGVSGNFAINGNGGIIFAKPFAFPTHNYVIKNSGTGTLTLSSGVDIVYDAKGTSITNAVITDTIGGKYSFGSGSTQSAGTQISASDTNPIIGLAFAPAAATNSTLTLGGVLGVSGGNASATGTGGGATALSIDASKAAAILQIDASLTLQASGGNGAKNARIGNTGGDVAGIELSGNTTNKITIQGGNLSLILKPGLADDGKTSASAFALKNIGKVEFANGTSLSTLSSIGEKISIDGNYGIYNASSASYTFGTSTSFAVSPSGGNAYGAVLSSKMDMQSGNASFTVTSATADAYAILADKGEATFSANANLEFTVNSTVGKAVGIAVKNDASLTLNGSGTLKLKVGDTNTKEAYGFRLEGGKYYGDFGFEGTNSYIKSGAGGVSYGVYTIGDNELDATTLTFADNALTSGANGQVYTLYNAGNLTLKKTAKIIQGADASGREKVNLYAGASSTLNVTLGEGSKTLFQADTAIGGAGSVNLVLQNNAGAKFDGISTAIATTGEVNIKMIGGSALIFSHSAFDTTSTVHLTLEGTQSEFGKVLFGDEAGEIDTLNGEYGVFLLAGEDPNARFASKALKTRTLTIKDMNLNHSGFTLSAKGGTTESDRVVIEGSASTSATPQNPLNNNISIIVDRYATDDKNVVTLATVASGSQDKVIFNSLTEDDQETKTTIYQGFTKGVIKIKREADGSGGSKYTSTLRAGEIVINPDFISPTAAALSSSLELFSANLNSLSKRMGELNNGSAIHGAWSRVFVGEQISDFGAEQSVLYATFQAGYDYRFSLKDADNYLGVALSYSRGVGTETNPTFKTAPSPIDIQVSGAVSSNLYGVEIALYNSYIDASGFYSDSVFKLGDYISEVNMYHQVNTKSLNNLAFALSEEVGYKAILGESREWFITPQGEISYGYIQGSKFTQYAPTGESMDSQQEDVMLLRSRIGVAWGYDFAHLLKAKNIKASIYLGTYYLYDYLTGGDTTLSTWVNGENVNYRYNAYSGSSRFAINLGTNIDIKDGAKVYIDFEKSFFGKIKTNYQINFGVRVGFGEGRG